MKKLKNIKTFESFFNVLDYSNYINDILDILKNNIEYKIIHKSKDNLTFIFNNNNFSITFIDTNIIVIVDKIIKNETIGCFNINDNLNNILSIIINYK